MEGEKNASPRPPSLESGSTIRGRGTSTRSSSNPTLSMDVVPLEKVSEDEEDDDNSFDHRDDHEQIAGFFSPNEVHKPTMESMAMAMALATCEIARLPNDLLSALLARTGPLDVCRAAVVSWAFRAAADADAIWSSFLPHDLPPLADGELPADPQTTKKQLFMRLSNSARPVLLTDALTKPQNSWKFPGWISVARYIASCSPRTQLMLPAWCSRCPTNPLGWSGTIHSRWLKL